jgi:alpha-1,3-rhamnosyltransferase
MNPDGTPLVTAVIPVYNHEKYVIESIRSIVGQSYDNIELIVINDGSTDHSHELILTIVEECKQRCRRFEYINRDNIGLSATLNQALDMAKGKYFSPLASDDIAIPEKFSVLIEALELTDETYAAAFGNALLIDEHTNRIWLTYGGLVSKVGASDAYDNYLDFRTGGGKIHNYRSDDFSSYRSLLSHNCLPAMSTMIKTDLIRQVGAWTVGNASEDWEMWRKLSKRHNLLYIDKPLALYRWHDSNSVKVMNDKLGLDDVLNLMKEKQYCASHGLISFWRVEYAGRLLSVLADERIPLIRKLSLLDLSEISRPSFCWHSAKRLVRKILRFAIRKSRMSIGPCFRSE